MHPDHADTKATIERLKQEILRLTDIQIAEMKKATFMGMSPEQAKENDARRSRISELINQVARLQTITLRESETNRPEGELDKKASSGAS